MRHLYHIVIILTIIWPSLLLAQDITRPVPEHATGMRHITQGVTSGDYMVVTAHPLATQAARDIIEDGGNAIDAAITAQLVLGLVEPQSSGLGGGGFALYYDNATHELVSWDGRERAPVAANPSRFLDGDGNKMDFYDAAHSSLSIGVPAMPRLLEEMHKQRGVLSWSMLFDRAITLARDGFSVTPRLYESIEKHSKSIRGSNDTRQYFEGVQVGGVLKNQEYADSLMAFQRSGSAFFYQGGMAHKILAKTFDMTMEDLQAYRVIQRAPVCAPYKAYRVCSMGQPSSGGLTVLYILRLLDPYRLDEPGKRIDMFARATEIAFADRNYYMADPDYVDTPDIHLLDDAYIHERRKLLLENGPYDHGVPIDWPQNNTIDISTDKPGTTHVSIIDRMGNALSMTSSIESAFGSHRMVGGFLLNNQLTDFSFISSKDGLPVANRVEGGKRPRSSMSPVVVFDSEQRPVLVIGSAGGARIIPYVAQRIIDILGRGVDPQIAFNAPNITKTGKILEIEDKNLAQHIKDQDYDIRELNSGLHGISVRYDGSAQPLYIGVVDPRREGLAAGTKSLQK